MQRLVYSELIKPVATRVNKQLITTLSIYCLSAFKMVQVLFCVGLISLAITNNVVLRLGDIRHSVAFLSFLLIQILCFANLAKALFEV